MIRGDGTEPTVAGNGRVPLAESVREKIHERIPESEPGKGSTFFFERALPVAENLPDRVECPDPLQPNMRLRAEATIPSFAGNRQHVVETLDHDGALRLLEEHGL